MRGRSATPHHTAFWHRFETQADKRKQASCTLAFRMANYRVARSATEDWEWALTLLWHMGISRVVRAWFVTHLEYPRSTKLPHLPQQLACQDVLY